MKPTVLVFAVMLMALSACQTAPREPIIVTKEVSVPLVVKCRVEAPVRPKSVVQLIAPGAGFYDKGVAFLKENQSLRDYATELESALSKCSESPGPAPTK